MDGIYNIYTQRNSADNDSCMAIQNFCHVDDRENYHYKLDLISKNKYVALNIQNIKSDFKVPMYPRVLCRLQNDTPTAPINGPGTSKYCRRGRTWTTSAVLAECVQDGVNLE